MKISEIFESKSNDNKFNKNFPNIDLFHGSMDYYEDGDIIKFDFRKSPKDTFNIFHNEVNTLSMKKFNLPVRSLFFASRTKNVAEGYGDSYKIFPLGDFRIFASSYQDMTQDLSVQSSEIDSLFDNLLENRINDDDISYIREFEQRSSRLFISLTLDFNGFNKKCKEIIDDIVEESESISNFYQVIDNFCEKYKNLAKNYVNEVFEVKSEKDIISRNKTNEIMIYSPIGIYVESGHIHI